MVFNFIGIGNEGRNIILKQMEMEMGKHKRKRRKAAGGKKTKQNCNKNKQKMNVIDENYTQTMHSISIIRITKIICLVC